MVAELVGELEREREGEIKTSFPTVIITDHISHRTASPRNKMAISVVDIENISLNIASPSSEDYANLAQEIKSCFGQIGFMYIKNHGIPAETIQNAMKESLNFFQLDKKVKEKTRKGVEYQGWVEQGREIFDQDEEGKIAELEVRETFDMKNISAAAIFPDQVNISKQ